ncbi:MAG: zinc ribbon domain-containing protein, partial [Planctomycetaceae bacterium]
MSTAIHNCPQCRAVIIADTDECPDCGHVLDQSRAEKVVLLDDA